MEMLYNSTPKPTICLGTPKLAVDPKGQECGCPGLGWRPLGAPVGSGSLGVLTGPLVCMVSVAGHLVPLQGTDHKTASRDRLKWVGKHRLLLSPQP